MITFICIIWLVGLSGIAAYWSGRLSWYLMKKLYKLISD